MAINKDYRFLDAQTDRHFEMLFQRVNQLGNTSSSVEEGEWFAEPTYNASSLVSVMTYYTTSLKNQIVKKETYNYSAGIVQSVTEQNYVNGKVTQSITYPVTYSSGLLHTVERDIT